VLPGLNDRQQTWQGSGEGERGEGRENKARWRAKLPVTPRWVARHQVWLAGTFLACQVLDLSVHEPLSRYTSSALLSLAHLEPNPPFSPPCCLYLFLVSRLLRGLLFPRTRIMLLATEKESKAPPGSVTGALPDTLGCHPLQDTSRNRFLFPLYSTVRYHTGTGVNVGVCQEEARCLTWCLFPTKGCSNRRRRGGHLLSTCIERVRKRDRQ